MTFIRRLVLLFTVSILTVIGCYLLAFAMNKIDHDSASFLLYMFYHDADYKMILWITATVILFFAAALSRLFSVNVHRDKIIAFDNPNGRVTVSLFAMEDLVRRLISRVPEVKDAKVRITAAKKKLNTRIKLALGSDMNIPEITANVQTLVHKKIQDTIGIEEKCDVAVYVGKILPARVKEPKKEKKKEEKPQEPNVPFQGYRP